MVNITLFWPADLAIDNPYPKHYCLPLGVAYISKVLESEGFEVTVIDTSLFLTEEDMGDEQRFLSRCVDIVKNTDPDILGIGSWTCNMPFVAKFAEAFKEESDIPIILGGYNATHIPDETLFRIPEIDYVVRGEGEWTMLELCKVLSSNNPNDVKRVRGISYFPDKKGKVIHTPDRPQIAYLDDLPIIDFELFKNIKNDKVGSMFQFMISRGCVGNCVFCNTPSMWPCVKYFSKEHLDKQFKHFVDLYGLSNLNLADDTINSSHTGIKHFTNLINEKYPEMTWGSSTRIDLISRDTFKELKASGLKYVFVGIESVIPESLRFLNKTNDPYGYIAKIPKSLDILKELDITTSCPFICGIPNERKEDLAKTKDYVLNLLDKYTMELTIFDLTVFPGTPLWDMYMKGDIGLLKVADKKIRLFASHYQNYPWMTPEYYCIKKNHMSLDEYFKITGALRKMVDQKVDEINPERIAFLPLK